MSRITFDDKVTIEEHQEIPAVNKISAGDINAIKNAINDDSKYLTATKITGYNNRFQVSTQGTVQLGDIFHIYIPSTTDTQTAYLKINDGNLYAIVNEYGTLIKASQISNRYITLVYTGYQSGNAFRYLPTTYKVSDLMNDSSYVTSSEMTTALGVKENTANKVTEITAWSTDTQYPSAKAVNSQIQNLRNATNLNLTDSYYDMYEYAVGDIVVHEGKKYICVNPTESYTFWDEQKTITEILTNESMVGYIDDEYIYEQILNLWPSFTGGSSQPLTVSVDEQGPVTISCPALSVYYTYSNAASIEANLGISVNPGYNDNDFTFIINFDACWAWIRDNEEKYSTNEVKTGMRWVDGSPIYRKVFVYHNITLDSANVTLSNSAISDLNNIINFSAMGMQTGGSWGFLNAKSHPSSKDWDCSMYYENGIHAEFGATARATSWHFNIIIEYTKSVGKG